MLHTTIRGQPVRTIDDLIELFGQELRAFDRVRDNRAAFLRVYLAMTRRVKRRLAEPFFLDRDWSEAVALRFGAWYFAALDAFNAGRPAPPAWQLSFEAARDRRTFLVQDILLGINAHINNDLPQVLAEFLRGEGETDPLALARRRFDHDQINRLLHQVATVVERDVAPHYGRLIRVAGLCFGRLDQRLAAHGLQEYRDRVWHQAASLTSARTEEERRRVIDFIEADALEVARAIHDLWPSRLLWRLAAPMRRWRLA